MSAMTAKGDGDGRGEGSSRARTGFEYLNPCYLFDVGVTA